MSNTRTPSASKLVFYIIAGIFCLLGVTFGIICLLQGNYVDMAKGFAAPLFLLIPLILKKLTIPFVPSVYSMLFAFCILAYDFGSVLNLFDTVPFLDKISHFLSGLVFTIIGYCLYFKIAPSTPQGITGKPFLSSSYALFFSSFVAVIWECFEFFGFLLTGHDSQHTLTTGVFDTMGDLIACLLGSVICIAAFALSVKKSTPSVSRRLVQDFYNAQKTPVQN